MKKDMQNESFWMVKNHESVELSLISWPLAIQENVEIRCRNGSQNPWKSTKNRALGGQDAIVTAFWSILEPFGRPISVFFSSFSHTFATSVLYRFVIDFSTDFYMILRCFLTHFLSIFETTENA